MAEPVLPESITDGQISHEPHHETLHAWHNTHIDPATGDLYTPDDFIGGAVGATGPTGATGPAGIAGSTIAPGVASVVGDGVADDTVAIQAILTAALSGARVDVARGTYKLSDQGAGFCLNISTKFGLHLVGPTHGNANPSATGGSATFFQSSATATKIFNSEASALNHYGPHIENIRIEDRGGNATCFSLKDYNNYAFRCVTFQGVGGSTTGTGLKIDAAEDASYGDIDNCDFHHNLIGCSLHGSAGAMFKGGYFQSSTVNHVLLDLQNGSSATTVVGTKFEGGLGAVAGAIGVQVGSTGDNHIIGCNFEGCKTGINLVAQGSVTATQTSMVSNSFTGTNGTETGIIVGANRVRDKLIGNRYSNLAGNVTDNGTDTIVFGTRADTAFTGEFMRIGGLFFGEGSAAPANISVPDGATYWQKGTGVFYRYAGNWIQVTPPQTKGISSGVYLGSVATNATGLANAIGPAAGTGAVAIGQFLVIAGGFEGTTTPVITISDPRGNTWTIDRQDDRTTGVGCHSFVASCKVTAALLAADQITVHFASNVDNPLFQLYKYGGMNTGTRVDQATGATGSSTAPSSGSMQTTENSEMVFSSVYYAAIPTFTASAGWAPLNTQLVSSQATGVALQQTDAGGGAYTAAGTLSSTTAWAVSEVSYKTVSPAGGFTVIQGGTGAQTFTSNAALTGNGVNPFVEGPRMFSRAGTPEGNVTAPVGSLCTRTDGGTATTLYVKESGAGNTGWVAK